MTDAINWHPFGTKGPYRVQTEPTIGGGRSYLIGGLTSTHAVALVFNETDALMFAEGPAMVHLFRAFADCELPLPGWLHGHMKDVRAILSRIDGGAA